MPVSTPSRRSLATSGGVAALSGPITVTRGTDAQATVSVPHGGMAASPPDRPPIPTPSWPASGPISARWNQLKVRRENGQRKRRNRSACIPRSGGTSRAFRAGSFGAVVRPGSDKVQIDPFGKEIVMRRCFWNSASSISLNQRPAILSQPRSAGVGLQNIPAPRCW